MSQRQEQIKNIFHKRGCRHASIMLICVCENVRTGNMTTPISDSRFYMWRTLFAVAHADNIVTDEELEFMAHVLEDVAFTTAQTDMLKDDIMNPKDVEKMFQGVTDQSDRIEFFDFARDLVWVDGDFGSEEQSVMIKLHQEHIKRANVDDMIGKVTLELEDDRLYPSKFDGAPNTRHEHSNFYGAMKNLYKKIRG